jgi:NitT/TauT family transport system substrate-binding protein
VVRSTRPAMSRPVGARRGSATAVDERAFESSQRVAHRHARHPTASWRALSSGMLTRTSSALLVIACACGSSTPAPAPNVPVVPAADAAVTLVADAAMPDPAPERALTTVNHFRFVEAIKVQPVTKTAAFKPLGTPRVVRFAVNTWVGWAPILYANGGGAPKRVWKDPRGGEFLLELVIANNAEAMTRSFAAGEVHVAWATVDLLPLFVEWLGGDARTLPRVVQLVDWSSGADGIKHVADLRGKTIAVTQHAPSHYFLLATLRDGGLSADDVTLRFTEDGFQAAAAFNQTPEIDAVATWAPDIEELAAVQGNRVLLTTALANRAIAGVWMARADFAKAHPGVIEALVRGGLDAAHEIHQDAAKQHRAAELVDSFFKLPEGTGARMFGDAQLGTYVDSRALFLDPNSPTSFREVYESAASIFRSLGLIEKRITADRIADASILRKLGSEVKYQAHTTRAPQLSGVVDPDRALFTKTVAINFFPNSADLWRQTGRGQYYDPKIEQTIAELARLAHKYSAARIHIGGFTDASMKGVADEQLVLELSKNRAIAVRDAIVSKYKLDPTRFTAEGFGWTRPLDPADPDNHAKNRRIEVRVLPAK